MSEAPEALRRSDEKRKEDGAEKKIRATIARMSLEEKVGQLFMVSFRGIALTNE